MEEVILVNEQDQEIGTMEKIEAHKKALLHRAFSIFIFNSKGELLLQQRAAHKYHSPQLWTNTCCSHQRPNESTIDAANRRLKEEMGMNCELKEAFTFKYKTPFDNGLTEHEFDHVLIGSTDTEPEINKDEVMSFEYKSLSVIESEILSHPENFTSWFKICLPKVKEHYENELNQNSVR